MTHLTKGEALVSEYIMDLFIICEIKRRGE